jgi:hypothetical protein
MSRLAALLSRRPSAMALGLFILSFLMALPFSAGLWPNYILQPTHKFDLDIYLTIARNGYHLPSSPAFYPLWPMGLSWFGGLSDKSFTLLANGLSFCCFALCLPLFWNLVKYITDDTIATWSTLLFALNPNSIFHALGYPESLFSLLSVLFLWASVQYLDSGSVKSLAVMTVCGALMSATRPVLTQLAAAGLWTIVLHVWFRPSDATSASLSASLSASMSARLSAGMPSPMNTTKGLVRALRNKQSIWYLAVLSSAVAGYVPFGVFCKMTFGNFWQPFTAQSYWNRSFGLHWSLFTAPQSVGGSDNILTWDLLAFYGPAILLLILLRQMKSRRIHPLTRHSHQDQQAYAATRSFIGLFCLSFAAAHSGIAFISYPIFMSLGRHVFATPFVFVGLAVVISAISLNAPSRQKIYRYALAAIIISMLYLIHFWTRFGRSAWLG